MQSKKRKIFYQFFVLKPWGFVIFLLLGLGIFFSAAINIKIPVYTTIKTDVVREKDKFRLNLHDKEFEVDTPIFLYHSRDDHLEKVTSYQIENGFVLVDPIENLSDKQTIYIDIQTGEISLLQHIFIEGGNN